VDDLIRGMIALAESGHHDPVNIGNPDEFTLLELAETVLELTGSASEIVHEALPTDDPKQRRPDITKANQILGWQPAIQLREGLQRTIDESGIEVLVGTNR
jgi:dTDP-glucose 4,6-dehydratase